MITTGASLVFEPPYPNGLKPEYNIDYSVTLVLPAIDPAKHCYVPSEFYALIVRANAGEKARAEKRIDDAITSAATLKADKRWIITDNGLYLAMRWYERGNPRARCYPIVPWTV